MIGDGPVVLDQGRTLVAIGLGSNQPPTAVRPFTRSDADDPRARAILGALELLDAAGLTPLSASPVYETEAHDVPTPQPPYLNACALIDAPDDLALVLRSCKDIERRAGRATKGDLSPRPLDLDLLAAWRSPDLEPIVISTPDLVVPHPRLAARAFALVPACDVVPDLTIPDASGSRATLRELLDRLRASASPCC